MVFRRELQSFIVQHAWHFVVSLLSPTLVCTICTMLESSPQLCSSPGRPDPVEAFPLKLGSSSGTWRSSECISEIAGYGQTYREN
ncbi:hypothetical protein V8D89_002563 [Ganoderma adspersum]